MATDRPQQEETALDEEREIFQLLKKVGRHSFIRRLFEFPSNALNDSEEIISMLLAFLREPPEDRWRERVIATWALGQATLTPKQTQSAAQVLCKLVEGQNLSMAGRLTWRLMRGIGRSFLTALPINLILTLMIIFYDLMSMPTPGLLIAVPILLVCFQILLTMLVSPIVVPLSLIYDARCANRIRAAAVTTLGRLGVLETVGTLVKACFSGSPQVERAALSALRIVLPRLTNEHYGQLPSDAVPNLCRLLHRCYLISQDRKDWLGLSVLNALEKIGDGRAVTSVQQVAEAEQTALGKVAQRVLPVLLERKRQEEHHSTLLRGAAQPVAAPEQLLRPAADYSAEPLAPEQLLRGAIGEEHHA